MKNLNITAKLAILVAVLMATVVTIAIVGVTQVARLSEAADDMVNTSAKAVSLTGDGRIHLIDAIRSEKNAILVPDRQRAMEFADRARSDFALLREDYNALVQVIGVNLATPEGKALSELDRTLDAFGKSQKEILRLAVLKSNQQGAEILFKDLSQRTLDAKDFLDTLADAKSDASGATAPANTSASAQQKRLAGQQVIGSLYELLYFAALHLNASDEKEYVRIDSEIRPRLIAYQDSLRRLSGLLDESDRSRGVAIFASLEGMKPQIAKIQELSHIGSDMYARELTITRSVELGNAGDAAMSQLRTAMKDRLAATNADVARRAQSSRMTIGATAGAGALLSLFIAWLTVSSIKRPVQHGVRVFEAIAGGDLTRRIGLTQRDEMGQFSAAADGMVGKLLQVVTQTRTLADRLETSAAELSSVSHDLLSQSQEMATQAESVAAATEQMSTNISGMAAAAEQMSVNVASISSASEEVSVNVASISAGAAQTSGNVGTVAESIGEINTALRGFAVDAREGSQMSQQARDMAHAANQAMQQLDQAAGEISKVTEVIKSIALQTNLLALNATIEATSAGEAGKGFAVVASEVKELASQSAQSAEEISRKIEGVQASTRQAVKVIDGVVQFIGQLNVQAGRMAEAVQVQTGTANQISTDVASARKGVEDIARSIAEVAKGATDVSGNTAEVSKAATDVSRNASEAAEAAQSISPNIHGVSEATRQNNASAVKVNEAARRLKDISKELQNTVSHFKTNGLAAS